MSEPWLSLRHVVFGYRGQRPILDDVSLELGKPGFVTLSGPSGAGKSTLLRLLAGHYRLRSGQILLHGEIVKRPGADRPLVFQDYKLFPWKTVYENVAAGLRFAGMDQAKIDARVTNLLDRGGLSDNRDSWPSQLSGGMRQRVAVLRSLAVEPKCLLLDEPFSALDADNVTRILNLVFEYLDRSGAVCFLATHDQSRGAGRSGHRLRISGNGQIEVAQSKEAQLAGSRGPNDMLHLGVMTP